MRSVVELDVPDPLRGHHRRCLDAVARLSVTLNDPAGAREHDPGSLAAEALNEIRAATRLLLVSRPSADRNAPVTRFLHCRLDRLTLAADDITEAWAAREPAALRRRVVQFRALVSAMWKVQLAVGAVPAGSGRSAS